MIERPAGGLMQINLNQLHWNLHNSLSYSESEADFIIACIQRGATPTEDEERALAAYELELIDDAFCNAYSARNQGMLSKAIDRLQDWRKRHGFEWSASKEA